MSLALPDALRARLLTFRLTVGQTWLWIYFRLVVWPVPSFQQRFFDGVFTLMGLVGRADGAIGSTETLVIDDFAKVLFAPSARWSREALMRVRYSAQPDHSIRDLAAGVYGLPLLLRFMRETLLDVMVAVAVSDDILAPSEERVLRRISAAWGISGRRYLEIVARRESIHSAAAEAFNAEFDAGNPEYDQQGEEHSAELSELAAAYKVLECDATTSDGDLKKIYRTLAMRHHPDRVAARSRGANLERETDRFRLIQEAYERVMRERYPAS